MRNYKLRPFGCFLAVAMPVQSCRCAPEHTREYFTPDGPEHIGSLLTSEVYQVPTNWLVLPTGVCPPSPSWGAWIAHSLKAHLVPHLALCKLQGREEVSLNLHSIYDRISDFWKCPEVLQAPVLVPWAPTLLPSGKHCSISWIII